MKYHSQIVISMGGFGIVLFVVRVLEFIFQQCKHLISLSTPFSHFKISVL